jgi:hypothetical protein
MNWEPIYIIVGTSAVGVFITNFVIRQGYHLVPRKKNKAQDRKLKERLKEVEKELYP